MARKSVSDLSEHIGYWMRSISNSASHAFASKLVSSEVTVAEWAVLRRMYDSHEVISQSDVTELTGLTKGAVSKLIDRLLQKKLISRAVSSVDRRAQEVKLTRTARSLVPKLAKIADHNDASFFSVLSASERKQLSKLLQKLAKNHQLAPASVKEVMRKH